MLSQEACKHARHFRGDSFTLKQGLGQAERAVIPALLLGSYWVGGGPRRTMVCDRAVTVGSRALESHQGGRLPGAQPLRFDEQKMMLKWTKQK